MGVKEEGHPPFAWAQCLSDQLSVTLLRMVGGVWPLPLLTLLTRTTAQEAKAAFVVKAGTLAYSDILKKKKKRKRKTGARVAHTHTHTWVTTSN